MELIIEAKRLQKLAGILKEDTTLDPEDNPIPANDVPIPAPIEEITKDQAKDLIKGTKGKFFTVSFIKRTDGTKRVMNARLGVKVYLKGGELPFDPEAKGLIPVYDIQKKDYRLISVTSIYYLKIGNKEYNVK
jgi:hypothetical protein